MKGYNAFLVPQSKNLPFSNTREDILIKKMNKKTLSLLEVELQGCSQIIY